MAAKSEYGSTKSNPTVVAAIPDDPPTNGINPSEDAIVPADGPRRKYDPPLEVTDGMDQDFILATVYVRDARDGRNLPFIPEQPYIRRYILYHNAWLAMMLKLCLAGILSLAIVEAPAVHGYALSHWNLTIEANSDVGSQVLEGCHEDYSGEDYVTIPIEVACILVFVARVLSIYSFMESRIFWRDPKFVVILVLSGLTILDICIYAGMISSGYRIVRRFSRAMRPLFIINFPSNRQIRRAFRNLRRTLPDVRNLLILLLFSIALFALMAYKLYEKRNMRYPNGDPYFNNFLDSFFDIYVLVTTSNSPDVMIPAYERNRWSVLVFASCIVVCLYIIMTIFLAVIFDNFKKHLKNEVKESVYLKRKLVAKAFNLLKESNIHREGNSDGRAADQDDVSASVAAALANDGISWPTFETWMAAYVIPEKSRAFVKILWDVLDDDGALYLSQTKFLAIADLLNVKVTEIQDRQKFLERMIPKVYNSKPSRLLRRFVRRKAFRYIFDLLILVNAVFIGFDVQGDWAFLAFFTLEIILKLYTFGGMEFFSRFWNTFDFFVIGTADLLLIVEAALNGVMETRATLDALLVLRVLRVIKLIGSIKGFKVFIKTIMNLGPALVVYGGVLFMFYYSFAIIGMELFSGLIHQTSANNFCDNPRLDNSAFAEARYCINNFNDILSSFVVLFELTVVNQWHVITQGYVLVTNKWARLFFVAFHMICVVIILNIFTAFVIEGYLLESSFSKGEVESKLEEKINEMGLGLGSKPKWIKKAKKAPKPDEALVDNIELEENEDDETLDADHEPRQFESMDAEPDANASVHDDEWIRRAQNSLNVANEAKIRFHLSSGSKSVEVLLHRMFENEIGDDDIGEEGCEPVRPRKLTLDSVA